MVGCGVGRLARDEQAASLTENMIIISFGSRRSISELMPCNLIDTDYRSIPSCCLSIAVLILATPAHVALYAR